jgi:hypothetical protein
MKQLIFIILLFCICRASGSSDWTTLWIPKLHAIVKPPERVDIQFRLFIEHLGMIESSNQWQAINSIGCMGKYQFAQATLELLGYHGITPERFRSDPSVFPEVMQERALKDLIAHNLHYLSKFTQYIGQVVNGVRITRAGLIAASHLGGVGGVQRFLTSNHNATDMNGSSVQKYLKEFQQYNV